MAHSAGSPAVSPLPHHDGGSSITQSPHGDPRTPHATSVPSGAEASAAKKACDLCRRRKVKCRVLQGETECDGCTGLGVPCTRVKPRRRRGPPSQHALAQLKIVYGEEPAAPAPDASSVSALSPSSVSAAVQNATTQPLDMVLARLAPKALVLRVLHDWFKLVHPIAPVLHRQRLLQRLRDHGSEHSPVLAALVLSTCAVTVSTLRRQSFEHYPEITVERCVSIIEDGELLRSQPITVEWCIAWYHMASALLVDGGNDDFRTYRAIREAMTGVHWLVGCRFNEQTLQEKETLKRVFWLLYMWQVAAEIRGQSHLTFLPIKPDLELLRPQVLTDRELYPDLVGSPTNPSWPEDDLYFVAGFNGLVDTFRVWAQAKLDMVHREPAETLERAVTGIQNVLDSLPPTLRWTGRISRFPRAEWGDEVQMVNIAMTALWLKSNFLQHLGRVLPGLTHQDIASDALEILDRLPQLMFEANGHAVVYKLRDIGAAYLAEAEANEGQGGTDIVQRLIKVLENLDFHPPLEGG